MNTNTKRTKKGFTITELVIVIAVIAILAAVLIPTFANVISRANKSATMQEARGEWSNFQAEALLTEGAGDDYLVVVYDRKITETDKKIEAAYYVVDGHFDPELMVEAGADETITIDSGLAIDGYTTVKKADKDVVAMTKTTDSSDKKYNYTYENKCIEIYELELTPATTQS